MESKFQFSVSRRIALLLAGGGATATAGIMLIITIPAPFRIAAAAVIFVLFAAAVRRHAFLRGARAVRGVEFLPNGEIEIAANNGVWRGHVESARPSPLLTVFTARCGKVKFSAMACDDGMPPDLHRQLRARLADAKKPPPAKGRGFSFRAFRIFQKNSE
ncbi:MAG: hypothetical protein HAW59_01100 [Betaproteobacteria bacterium]|nr:hypothetical protein [Betaproteobacteria bacterium]